jgi:hypothetical protein
LLSPSGLECYITQLGKQRFRFGIVGGHKSFA